MKSTINFSQFVDGFENRKDNFTYEGQKALFNHLEEYEECTGEEIEFDPIALCCDYTEWGSFEEFSEMHPDIEKDDIGDYTTFIDIDGTRFITQNF